MEHILVTVHGSSSHSLEKSMSIVLPLNRLKPESDLHLEMVIMANLIKECGTLILHWQHFRHTVIKLNYLVHLCILLETFFMTLEQLQHPFFKPQQEIKQRFWAWHQVERNRQSSSLLKIGKPKFGPCKFPLHISVILDKCT